MRGIRIARLSLCCVALAGKLAAQTPKIDFAKDVQPIFQKNCVPCHGPAQQSSGFRVDRKNVVLGRRGVVPGSSENSFLFHRVSGSDYGMQMPPTGALRAEQIEIIKKWIDQGAEWPDALSNEVEIAPLDPQAIAMVNALAAGDPEAFLKSAAGNPKLLNARGPEGSTPFMYAVLYTGAPTLQRLLQQGADVNKRNDAKATALMWAATDLDKTRLLVARGADVNARSGDMRTPLMIAARRPGNSATVKFLLEHGANPNPNAHPVTESSPLIEAANAGDAASLELLLAKGADVKDAAEPALEQSYYMRCSKCAALLISKGLSKKDYTILLANIVALGDANAVRNALDHGADVNAVDPSGRTALMYAAVSDLLPLDVVKLLVESGADINARDAHKLSGDAGLTVLDIARQQGETPIVAYLAKLGAKSSETRAPVLNGRRENTIQASIQQSLPLIQQADANFMPKAACASCHNNSFAAMAVGAARKNGFRVDEAISAQQVKANVMGLEKLRDILHQGNMVGVGDTFAPFILADILIGLTAEHYKPDLSTDTAAMFLKSRQSPDGQWAFGMVDTRPPVCSQYIGQTAVAMRALQLYSPKAGRAAYDRAIQLAAVWLANAQSTNNEDRGNRLLGLAWANMDKDATAKAMQELLAKQRPDGGWSDLDSTESSAYATGKSLYALQIAGLPASDTAYERAVAFLLKTQLEDGSWYVRTRALAIQPYFDAGFPHGFDQWISAAATSWATYALAQAAQARTSMSSGDR
jgi:ankyrin repeat protein